MSEGALRGWCLECPGLRTVEAIAEATDADVRSVTVGFACGHTRSQEWPLRAVRMTRTDTLVVPNPR